MASLEIPEADYHTKDCTVKRFEDFVKPDPFEKLIQKSQWLTSEEARQHYDFETYYNFFAPIAEASAFVTQSATLLQRISSRSPRQIQPSLEHTERLAAVEIEGDELDDEVKTTILKARIRPARITLMEHKRDLQEALDAVPADTLQEFQDGSQEEKEKMVAELFKITMDENNQDMLDTYLYATNMRTIRTLVRCKDSEVFISNVDKFLETVTKLEEMLVFDGPSLATLLGI